MIGICFCGVAVEISQTVSVTERYSRLKNPNARVERLVGGAYPIS
jgi:hypothetical protein